MKKTICIDYDLEEISVTIEDDESDFVGMAQCNSNDEFDEKIGIKLATARAELGLNMSEISQIDGSIDIDWATTGDLDYLREVNKRLASNIRMIDKHTQG